MARIRQGVAAGVSQHVAVDLEREAGALAYALDKAIDSVRRERAAALGREHKAAIGELPLQLAQGPDFVAAQRMHRSACRS